MKSLSVLLAGVFLSVGIASAAEAVSEPKLADFAEFAEKELAVWKAPGVSVAIVRGEDLLLATGYGFKDLKAQAKMTEKTVQPIASISKSFTVASLAALAREGKLSWDKPVREYMPEFRLYDDWATAHVSPRDLVTHGTGLPRHDWVWVGSTASREDFVRRLRYLEPSAEPRTKYQYNNLAYCTAGYLAGRVAGSSWEELVRTKIFEPLGMANASFSVNDLAKNEDHATGYRLTEKEEPVALRYWNVDQLGPAGAINANALEMSRYLRMLIGRGTFEGKEILSKGDVAEITSQKIVVNEGDSYKELGSAQYGMGFRITTYRGKKLVHHSGALRGLSASLSFLPEEKIGVFVQVNCSDSSLTTVLTYAAFDRLLDLKPIDWSKRFKERREKDKASRDEAKALKISTKREGTQPGHSLEEYVGEYEHLGYGIFRVGIREGKLDGSYNATRSVFEHFHYEVFEAPRNESNSLSEQKIQFVTSIDGDVESVLVQLEPNVKAIEFKRKAEARMFEPEFLQQFVADYQVGASRVAVALRADKKLTWTVGGTARELEPARGARFSMKDREGYSVEFSKDDAGEFNRVAVHTPSGSSAGKRIKN